MKNHKIVVFDLDQTLGDFGNLSLFWSGLQNYVKQPLNEPDFYYLMDAFPQVLRPNILNILEYLKNKKENGNCARVMIYTNNNGEKKWSLMIKRYLEYKINGRLFDRTIAAYKVNGRPIERLRTTHDKTYEDLCRCGHLPQNIEVCFVDDLIHPQMNKPNLFYLHIPAYHCQMSSHDMIQQFLNSSMGETLAINRGQFYNHMASVLSSLYPSPRQNQGFNDHNGQMLFKYIQYFLTK